MNEIEKRELIEQQRKILEAGTQRVEKRTGFFSFLTWPFFIAPLIASQEFLTATLKSGAAEQEDAKTALAGLVPHAANGDLPASDPSKMKAENEAVREPSTSSQAHTAQFDPAGLFGQSDDVPKLSVAQSEVAANGGGRDAGDDDVDFRNHDTHTQIEDSSINSLSADFHFGSGQLPGGSTLESLQSNGLADWLGPSVIGSAPLGNVGSLSSTVIGTIAPSEAAVQPALATASDAVNTLTHDAVGTIAPVEAAVQPVVATVTDSVSTLSHDAVGTMAPVEAAVQPVLATATDSVSTLSHDAVSTIAPVEAAVQPVVATVADSVSTLTHDAVGTTAPVEAAVQPMLANAIDSVSAPIHDVSHTADTGNIAGDTLANSAPAVDITEPVFAGVAQSHSTAATDSLQPVVADASTGYAAGPADALLALATATDAPSELPASATAAPANVVTGASNAAAVVHPSAIAGDVIALNDAPTPPAHALFNGSQYTDYGVTLSSDIAVPSQPTAPPADPASAHDTLVPVVADAQKQAPPPPDIVDTTHSIDHLGHAML
jgi:hypothetical protein